MGTHTLLSQVRVVLNKAQEVDNDRLLKVYGALMWSISRCLGGKSAAPKVYVGSFWDGPRRHPDDRYVCYGVFDGRFLLPSHTPTFLVACVCVRGVFRSLFSAAVSNAGCCQGGSSQPNLRDVKGGGVWVLGSA